MLAFDAMPLRRADKRRHMEQAVLDCATELLRAGGPEALTIVSLAKELGVSVGGLYRYYPSKGSILVGLEKRAIASYAAVQEQLLAELEPRLKRAPMPRAALSRVLLAASAYGEHARRDPVQHDLLTQLLAVPVPLLDEREVAEVEAHVQPILARSTELLVAAMEAGALSAGNALLRTYVLWAAVHGADQFRKRDRLLPSSLHASVVSDAAVEGLLLGWGADPDVLEAAGRAL
jgi:AcrR family transcriptional regulator